MDLYQSGIVALTVITAVVIGIRLPKIIKRHDKKAIFDISCLVALVVCILAEAFFPQVLHAGRTLAIIGLLLLVLANGLGFSRWLFGRGGTSAV